MKVNVQTKPYESFDVANELACVRMLISELEKGGAKIFKSKPEVLKQISGGITADRLCDILAFNLPLEYASYTICTPSTIKVLVLLRYFLSFNLI